QWFIRDGHVALLTGSLLPGVRHFTSLVAGTTQLEYPSFATYAYSGAVFWVCTFVFIGLHFGEHWETVLRGLEHNLRLATIVAAVLVTGYFLVRYLWLRRR